MDATPAHRGRGRPPKAPEEKPWPIKLTAWMSVETDERLRRLAEQEDRPLTYLVREALNQYLDEELEDSAAA